MNASGSVVQLIAIDFVWVLLFPKQKVCLFLFFDSLVFLAIVVPKIFIVIAKKLFFRCEDKL